MTELAIQFDTAAAERRAERIRLRLDAIADNYSTVMPMIREAIEKRDDQALGYRSVSEYVADRFGGALQRLGVDTRREVVKELTAAGMSTRAIAPVVGVDQATVVRDVARDAHASPEFESVVKETQTVAGDTEVPPEPEPDPSVEPANEPDAIDNGPADMSTPSPATKPRPVVGIDGKTYTAKPRKFEESQEDREHAHRALTGDLLFGILAGIIITLILAFGVA